MSRSQEEFKLHCWVADCLRRFGGDAIWFHPASGEYRPPATAGRLKRMGVQRGVPDLVFVLPNGKVAFLELKRPGGKLSPEQTAFRERVVAIGCPYAICETGEGAVSLLQSWGILGQMRVAA